MSRRKWILLSTIGPILLIALVLALNRPPTSPFEQLDPGVRVLNHKIVAGRGPCSMFLGGSELEGRIKQPFGRVLGWFGIASIIRPLTEIQLGKPPPNEFTVLVRYLDEAGASAPILEASLQDAHGQAVEFRLHGIGFDPQGRERVALWYLASVPEGFAKRGCRLVLKKESKVVATAKISIGQESKPERQ